MLNSKVDYGCIWTPLHKGCVGMQSMITCEPNVESHAEVLCRLLLGPSEAVYDAVWETLGLVFLQQPDHVVMGVALVKEKGFANSTGQLCEIGTLYCQSDLSSTTFLPQYFQLGPNNTQC